MVLVKDGVSESGTICDGEGEEGGQNTILRLDRQTCLNVCLTVCLCVCVLGHFWPLLVSVFAVGIPEIILTIWGTKNSHFCPFYWPFLVRVFAVCISVIHNMC